MTAPPQQSPTTTLAAQGRRGSGLQWARRALPWVVLVSMVLAAALGLTLVDRELQAELDQIEPRYARIVGVGVAQARIVEAARAASAALRSHAYPVTRDASQAGNDAQQRARDLFSKAGLEIQSVQVVAAKRVGAFDRIGLQMRVDGSLLALQASVAALARLTPAIFVESFVLQGLNPLDKVEPAKVSAELQLVVLREP